MSDELISVTEDAYRIMYYTARTLAGRDVTWEFVKTNFDDIYERYITQDLS